MGGPGRFAPPLLTAVISLNGHGGGINPFSTLDDPAIRLIEKLSKCDAGSATVTKSSQSHGDDSSIAHLSFPRFKKR